MRSKAPLVMMEQLVMVLVFALTAALCVQVFVLSEKLSVKASATDKAALTAQNVAERMKGDNPVAFLEASDAVLTDTGIWIFGFDESWMICAVETAVYRMEIVMEEDGILLELAEEPRLHVEVVRDGVYLDPAEIFTVAP